MSIQLKDLLNAEVKKKLENLEKNPKAKLPKQKKVKKHYLILGIQLLLFLKEG